MGDELRDAIIKSHNDYRSKHEGTPAVVWCEDLAQQAQAWADHIAQLGTMKHAAAKDRKGQGENIACCKGKPMNGEAATKQWYNEIKDFDFENKVFHHKTGHFTQVIWKGSMEIGAGTSSTEKGWNFCVARYAPAGNMKGKYEDNIGNLLPEGEALTAEQMNNLREEKKTKSDVANGKPPAATTEEKDANPNGNHWKDDCLKAHNDYRAKHQGTGNLTWSDTLAWEAQAWANQIANTGKPSHCPAKKRAGQGENLACAKGKPLTGADGTKQWYSEIKDFDFNNKVFNHKTGHFTQVIWKDCTEMGAGGSSTKDGWNFVVARYSPAGNLKGKYEENIGALKEEEK